jgi:hypothetical protein
MTGLECRYLVLPSLLRWEVQAAMCIVRGYTSLSEEHGLEQGVAWTCFTLGPVTASGRGLATDWLESPNFSLAVGLRLACGCMHLVEVHA